jgi:hypothetical protein
VAEQWYQTGILESRRPFAMEKVPQVVYNPTLVLNTASLSGERLRGQIQHAPGRFHSGAQVVKETEQAVPPLVKSRKSASRLRIRGAPRASAAGFRFNMKEIRND